ncbi:MAG: roadblock/LC7 domain-containing protein [Pseudomonadota bacterium]|nr:roadblock/LC7 domain-containing protein [Pseudomonadota bacterium]
MSVKLKLSPTAKVIAGREAQAFLDEVNGVTAVVIATIDGFDVASAMRSGDAARIAAMASSISAISSVVSQEAGLGRNKSVTIDTESGFAMVYSVHRDDAELVINIIADGSAILGQVAYRLAQFARILTEA